MIESIVKAFCNTQFEGGRHKGRVEKIEDNFCSFVESSIKPFFIEYQPF